jgi:hypothetical protein
MEIQLEFDFFDWEKYQSSRAQMIENNVAPLIGEEPQERYDVWLKRMFRNDLQS